MIKLIIFDLDGVLVDACEWHRLALNKALLKICNYEITLGDHYSIFNGLPTKVKLNMLVDKGIITPEKIDLVNEEKQRITEDIINSTAKPREEKTKLLKLLKDKSKIVCCYTNSIRSTANLILDKMHISEYFDKVVSNQDVIKSKPNPEGYIFLMNFYNIKPHDTIIVEDSPKGFEAAYLSGAKVFKVNNPDQVNTDLFEGFI